MAVRTDNFPGIELEQGTHCILVPVGDTDALAGALIQLLGDADARARIGRSGRRLVREHFDLGIVVERHLRVLAAMTDVDPLPETRQSSTSAGTPPDTVIV